MAYHQDYHQQQQPSYYPYQPPQQHYYEDDYAMQPIPTTNHHDPYYSANNEYNASNASTPMPADDNAYGYSDTKRLAPMPPQQSYFDKDDDDRDSRHERTCCNWFCCGCCCGCCPMWLRWCACGLLIIILALGITIGVLAALFKQPQVSFNGITLSNSTQPIQLNGTGFNFNFDLNIGVVNPNIESATFTSIKAVVYYPTAPTIPVGEGEKDNVHIGSQSITNITFPFQIEYDPAQSGSQAMMLDIFQKCGILGGAKSDLTVNYKVTVTINILGINISPTISESATFPCPFDSNDLPGELGSIIGSLTGGNSAGSPAAGIAGAASSAGVGGILASITSNGIAIPTGI
ncbi:hypothetical protein INT44_003758 [Umbelopsis vinacea]|uniref:Late embryogenesis abundant protein LEA-2 subgroup domain-containing protein n=1 Tax=Umbelopsis vinacea TaxID=44442 RepID=A0A8H7PX28_9FUNG|nr:hypothetical protein INT44_003758 [Umbelopsis vinacea]